MGETRARKTSHGYGDRCGHDACASADAGLDGDFWRAESRLGGYCDALSFW